MTHLAFFIPRFFYSCLYVCTIGLFVFPAYAIEQPLEDPLLEARAAALFKTIRCQVCQGESIDDSQSPLAKDMRNMVRTHIQNGDTDTSITDFLVSRYGNAILLETPVNISTLPLWMIPLFFFIGGIIFILIHTAPDTRRS